MTIQDWQSKGKFTSHRNHSIFYVDEGQGEVLLLIHGFPTSSWDWWKMWGTLSSKHRVLAPDMIGFGFSAKPNSYPYSLFDQADLIESFLAALGITEVTILCHDYGDTVTQELLARFNEREASETTQNTLTLKAICFLNGGLFPGTHKPLLIQKILMSPLGPLVAKLLTRKKLGQNFKKIFGPQTQPTESELDSYWELIEHNNGRAVSHKLIQYMAEREKHKSRWVGAMQKTSVPLRLIDGIYDPISGQNIVDRYMEIIPHPDVVPLKGIGHFPPVEAPELVIKHFLEFVERPF